MAPPAPMAGPATPTSSVVVLCKGGRLPRHGHLDGETRLAHRREHVDLMLTVAREHGLLHLEGFRLITRQQPWTHFWVMEFADLDAAEAWIDAEMAPPSGAYGFYEYALARRHRPDALAAWRPNPRPAPFVPVGADPHVVPPLDVERESVVVLAWELLTPAGLLATAREGGDEEHEVRLRSIAREHRMIRIEAFDWMAPQADRHRAWVVEFPTFEGAEAWIDTLAFEPRARPRQQRLLLARRWAPEYFATWPVWAGRHRPG